MDDEPVIRSWKPPNAGDQSRGNDSGGSEETGTPGSAYPGINGVRRVSWGGLPLGAIILDGPNVAGSLPPELREFPVVDRMLRDELYRKYHFRPDHPVTIASAVDRLAAQRFAQDVTDMDRRLREAEPLSREMMEQYARFDLTPEEGRAGESPRLTQSDRLVKDQYNSFAVPVGREGPIPTLIRSPFVQNVSTAGVIAGLITGRSLLPNDEPLTLHLALDVSFSMKRRDRIPQGLAAFNRLARQIPAVMPGTRVVGYMFSRSTRQVALPADRIPVNPEDTRQADLFSTVLRRRDRDRRNKLIVITDGEPSDLAETLRRAELLRREKFDYTQILLHTDEDLRREVENAPGEFEIRDNMIVDEIVPEDRIITLSEETLQKRREGRFSDFTRIAEIAGGNQVVLTEFDALGLVTVEIYDRYVGLLSLV